ncbi:MAG TPA: radical SAM protein [Thermoanaerobaculia bacterium]|nr:radical SAM protein [Thermoanaerobaculia bacterium]HUM30122.1 radical SAM protein [Thermoanaerobaculia bacterium]HXK68819.1 radical SAM protein [Thermoanaerobaculia bacterium]
MNELPKCSFYGPVASRRLGRSLGVDIVPYKVCTFDCIYCQLGRTTIKTIQRTVLTSVTELKTDLERQLSSSEPPDTITLAGSGEPTLHSGLGRIIREIKGITNIPLAVLTNGSLLWMPEVRESLMESDLVLPSLDAGNMHTFKKVNRPHTDLVFDRMVEGISTFTQDFPGEVWLEILLVAGINDDRSDVRRIADHVAWIKPARVQLNTAHRPPSESFVRPVPRKELLDLLDLFKTPAEIIAEFMPAHPCSHTPHSETSDKEILNLLMRRPCTIADVAQGIAIPILEAIKHLERLHKTGAVTVVESEHQFYYRVSDSRAPFTKGDS